MKKFLFTSLLMLTASGWVFSQTPADDYQKVEVFAGYSSHFYVDDPGPLVNVSTRGINTAAVYNFHRYWGVKADVATSISGTESLDFIPGFNNPTNDRVAYSQKLKKSTVTAGIQLKDNRKDRTFKPFAHALFGVGRLESKVSDVFCTTVSNCSNVPPNEVSTGFALLLGGGLDIKVSRRIDIRAVQLDITRIEGGNNTDYFRDGSTSFRFGAGVVFKF